MKYENIEKVKRLDFDRLDTQPTTLIDTVVRHEKEIQELKRLVTPMMEFKRREWVGLTEAEVNHIFAANVGYPERMMKEVEAKLKEKNGG